MKYKIVEPSLSPQEKAYQEFEATIMAHLEEMNKAGTGTFNDWLACQQALMQLRQMRALEGIFDLLNSIPRNPFLG